MYLGLTHNDHYCRWCGNSYTSKKPSLRDGFCSRVCKQAFYRAYKSYVTARARYRQPGCRPG